MAEAIHCKDPLATHLTYMPCFRRLSFEPSNLQKQDCLQRNGKPTAQQRRLAPQQRAFEMCPAS